MKKINNCIIDGYGMGHTKQHGLLGKGVVMFVSHSTASSTTHARAMGYVMPHAYTMIILHVSYICFRSACMDLKRVDVELFLLRTREHFRHGAN